MAIAQLTRMLGVERKYNRLRTYLTTSEEFLREEILEFHFFQFNSGNAKYFLQNDQPLDVLIAQLPHYQVAMSVRSGDSMAIEKAKREYLKYLEFSWPSHGIETSPSNLEEKYDRFVDLVQKTEAAGKLNATVILTKIPGRQGYFVVDGNHRCSIAAALGLPVNAKVLGFPDAFDQYMRVDEFYGTNNKNLPYQSIYIDKAIVRHGRREDIYDRLASLPPELLRGKTVLDVGCNIGMNAIGAYKSGARKVVGLEVSGRIVNFATRFAILDQCYPNVEFRQFNVDSDQLNGVEQFDIAFMLSVHHHLKNPERLAYIAKNNVTQAVVFEGHPDTNLDDYANFLNTVAFSRIEKLADLATSVFKSELSRPLWVFYK